MSVIVLFLLCFFALVRLLVFGRFFKIVIILLFVGDNILVEGHFRFARNSFATLVVRFRRSFSFSCGIMLFAVDGIDHGQAVRAETGERVGKHGTQFTDTLRDLRLTGLQVGDALLHTFKLALGCLTTLVDLLVGVFGGLLENAGSLLVGCLTLVGSVCLGLIARMLRF